MVFSLIQPITFGLDEQLITLSAVLSGYLNFPKKKILIALIIMAFSNALPDCLSYYDEKIGNGVDKDEAMKLTMVVFVTEVLSTVVILLPIILINNIKNGIMISYSLIFIILVYINYYKGRNILGALEKMPIYFAIGFSIWFISKMAQKYFKVDV